MKGAYWDAEIKRAQVDGLHDSVEKRTPAKRWGRPEDMTGIAVFLASAASDFVTGPAIPVDGATAPVTPAGALAMANAEVISGVTIDITERKEAEQRQSLLAREVDHRARNTLAVVQSILRLTRGSV